MSFNPKIVPFKRKAGIELTYHVPTHLGGRHLRDGEQECLVDRYVEIFNDLYSKTGENVYDEVYADPGCVEIPSPVLKSWTALERFWYFWARAAKEHNLTRFSDDHIGGAGHIHMDDTLYNQAKVVRDIAMRPYLGWVFLHPVDDENALSIAKWFTSHVRGVVGKAYWLMEKDLTEAQFQRSRDLGYMTSGQFEKYYVVKMSTDQGLEFRALSGAANLQEQQEHMAFTQAYFEYCVQNAIVNTEWRTYKQANDFLKGWTFKKSEMAFFDLILTLGLDPNAYEKYVAYYLRDRFKSGFGKRI